MLTIGVMAGERVAVGVVEENRVVSAIGRYPDGETLAETTAEDYVVRLRTAIEDARAGQAIGAIGVGMPGIIRGGLIEESPNLQQLKGLNLQEALSSAFPLSSIMIL